MSGGQLGGFQVEPGAQAKGVQGTSRPLWLSFLAILAIFAVVGSVSLWIFWKNRASSTAHASLDPRVNYTGPFENVHPSVQYVGDQACAGCHDGHLGSFAKHPMGQAMALVQDASKIERYEAPNKNPFNTEAFQYRISPPGKWAIHREEPTTTQAQGLLAELIREEPARFAVGSGAKARSYLIEKDGYLFQSPCTWYQREARWDLSPSFEMRNQHFNRTVTAGCLFCHANRADHIEGTENRYREPIFHGLPIGCERCHGPGEKHVQARLDGKGPAQGMDTTIVNPKWLDHSLKQAICEQCHVQGEQRVVGRGLGEFDFRPGLPLQDFRMDFVDKNQKTGGFKFVSSVEQMMQSGCYLGGEGAGKMGCTSCHDPHTNPETAAEKVKHYRARCVQCHDGSSGKKTCAVPETKRLEKQKDDYCVSCHMPQNPAEVNHASITDHSIPRVPGVNAKTGHRPTPGPQDLIPFHSHLIDPQGPEARRNLGLARMAMLNLGLPPKLAREMSAAALPPLEEAIARDPNDWPAIEGRADALLLNGRAQEAMEIYRRAIVARPDFEKTRFGAGAVALELGLLDEAVANFAEAVRINPYHPGYQHDLAVARSRKGDLAGAEKACRDALKQDPSRVKTRSLLILVLLRQGRGELAEKELGLLRVYTPEAKRKELDDWFREEKERASSRPG